MSARQRRFTRWLAGIVLAFAAAGAYLSYELGRYHAGYSLLDDRRRTAAYERELTERAARIEELERRQAILETSREIDRETYARVEQELERLQAQVQAQEEELAFYRGIVTPEDGVSGLRIQSFDVEPAAGAEGRVRVRLILVQAIVHNERVSGRVRLSVAGTQGGEAAELDEADLAPGAPEPPLEYEFRYFETLERDLALPVGFEPDTVTVRIEPEEPAGEPITQEYGWKAAGG